MNNMSPTVLILAEPQPEQVRARRDGASPMAAFSALDTTLRRVLASGLPLLLVAPEDQADAARTLLPNNDILSMPPPPDARESSNWLIHGIAAGVMARPHAPGWLLLPADMPMLQAETLVALAQGLRNGPLVYPCHRHVRGHPLAVSGELYSELIRLECEQDLRRLAARYPSVDVDVQDPGIHMTLEAQAGLNQLRAQLTGPLSQSRLLRTF